LPRQCLVEEGIRRDIRPGGGEAEDGLGDAGGLSVFRKYSFETPRNYKKKCVRELLSEMARK